MESTTRRGRWTAPNDIGVAAAALLSFVAVGAFWVLVYGMNPLYALIGVVSLAGALAVVVWHAWSSRERQRR